MKLTITHKTPRGFTIVELLIVIVVIGILAAITIVSFNGVQKKATTAATQSELAQTAKSLMSTAVVSSTGQYATIDAMPGGAANLKLDLTRYKVVSYCTNGSTFALAVQVKSGDEYYIKTNGTVIQDNSFDVFRPCDSFAIASATTTYPSLPAVCAPQGSSCTFTGTATVVYGSTLAASFTRTINATSPIACNDTTFGDPAFGYSKSCYVYPN